MSGLLVFTSDELTKIINMDRLDIFYIFSSVDAFIPSQFDLLKKNRCDKHSYLSKVVRDCRGESDKWREKITKKLQEILARNSYNSIIATVQQQAEEKKNDFEDDPILERVNDDKEQQEREQKIKENQEEKDDNKNKEEEEVEKNNDSNGEDEDEDHFSLMEVNEPKNNHEEELKKNK